MEFLEYINKFFDMIDNIAGTAEYETKRFIDRKILHTRFDTMQDYLDLNKKPSLPRKIISNTIYYYRNSKYLKKQYSFAKKNLELWLGYISILLMEQQRKTL